MSEFIAIIDYGMGNLHSVEKAFIKVGLNARITDSPEAVDGAARVVLPGVGAFSDAMARLEQKKLVEPIRRAIAGGRPFLGICLGLQLLFEESEEFGLHRGIGIFPGRVVRFAAGMPDPAAPAGNALKVPHLGWNRIAKKQQTPVLEGIADGSYFYFVHSYYVAPSDPALIATTTDYGLDFVSSIAAGNLFACQFHPEKSQKAGLRLLENFGRLRS